MDIHTAPATPTRVIHKLLIKTTTLDIKAPAIKQDTTVTHMVGVVEAMGVVGDTA